MARNLKFEQDEAALSQLPWLTMPKFDEGGGFKDVYNKVQMPRKAPKTFERNIQWRDPCTTR